MRAREYEAQKKRFAKLMRTYPFLYAINNLWHHAHQPQVQKPTLEFLQQPYPDWEKGEHQLWVHTVSADWERVSRPRFRTTGSLGEVLYRDARYPGQTITDLVWTHRSHLNEVERTCSAVG